jgi:carbonic anhydrase/acetyltransferase-like protein (isoleucine patch superfamily)
MHNFISPICNIRKFGSNSPVIYTSAYIDPQACIIGDVQIGKDSSIWPMAVVRGDVNFIKIGNNTNIQDGSILHVTHKCEYGDGAPLIIGDDVTVGHGAILHACTIGNNCLIGMGATIMDNCIIEDDCMIGAGSMLPPNKHVKSGELWLGNPAKKVRDLTDEQIQQIGYSARQYVKLSKKY